MLLLNSLPCQKALSVILATIYWIIIPGEICKIFTTETTQISSVVQDASGRLPLASRWSSILTVRHLDNWGPSMTLPYRIVGTVPKTASELFAEFSQPLYNRNILFASLWLMGKLRLKKISDCPMSHSWEASWVGVGGDSHSALLTQLCKLAAILCRPRTPVSLVLQVDSVPGLPRCLPGLQHWFWLLRCPLSYIGTAALSFTSPACWQPLLDCSPFMK